MLYYIKVLLLHVIEEMPFNCKGNKDKDKEKLDYLTLSINHPFKQSTR